MTKRLRPLVEAQITSIEVSTDTNNPELDNDRYYRNLWQTLFPSLYTRLGYNLREPQYHAHSSHFVLRHFERLHRLKQHHPIFARVIQWAVPLVLLASIPFVWTIVPSLVVLGSSLLAVQITVTAMASLLALVAFVSKWLGDNLFGDSVPAGESLYNQEAIQHFKTMHNTSDNDPNKLHVNTSDNDPNKLFVNYKSATATLILNSGDMPKLSIKADNPEDAGYVEGYVQGAQIEATLKNLNKLYNKIQPFIGAPADDAALKPYLESLETKIPHYYIKEMQAKVRGFNEWRLKAGLDDRAGNLEYYKYLLLQLLPDVQHFNPFNPVLNPCSRETRVPEELLVAPGCTTVAVKIGEYTAYLRVLDWPAYSIAGKGFIQIERKIGTSKKTNDLGLGLLSGCVTAINEDQVLTQINVSRVKKVGPQGMPGTFFIRYLAEHCESVAAMKTLLKSGSDTFIKQGPLSGMHVTATDGQDTVSYHAYQAPDEGHVLEILGERPLVVPNFGFNHSSEKTVDHHDSKARLENINHFFKSHPKDQVLTENMSSEEQINALTQYMSQIMKLDLVNNCESVFAGIFLYKGKALVHSRVAVDNILAGNRTPEQMARVVL